MGLIFENFSNVGGATAPRPPRLVRLCVREHTAPYKFFCDTVAAVALSDTSIQSDY